MQATPHSGGFDDPSRQAAVAFRAVMSAMARPGRIERLAGAVPPAPLSVAAGTLLLTLCDTDTPLHLAGATDCPEVRAWVAFHTGAPLAAATHCAFAVGAWEDLLPLSRYRIGTPEYPDRSATLICEWPGLAGKGNILTGPGINGTAELALPDADALRQSRRHFPLGLDVIFTHGDTAAALPRSTRIG